MRRGAARGTVVGWESRREGCEQWGTDGESGLKWGFLGGEQ